MQIWPAPAKLNLFLHIIGQREDGYHLLQSVIQFLDLCDELTFSTRTDGQISCKNSNTQISQHDDLCVKAAVLLREHVTGSSNLGVDIQVEKRIPLGAGMGGGSSDAATTLLALNQLWGCKLSAQELEKLAIQLGADVPVFIRGEACWVEGVGERLSSITLEECWCVVIFPNVHLNTQLMFKDSELTRNCAPIKIRDFLSMVDLENTENVFEPIARRNTEVERAFLWLNRQTQIPARLTGSGSALFAVCESKRQAEEIVSKCAKDFTAFVAKGLNCSPVISLSEYNHQHQ